MRRQTTMSLSLLLSVVVFLAVPTVYTLPASTFTRRYQSHFCGVGFSFPHWSVCLAALFIWHTDVMPWSDATPWVMYSNGTHDGFKRVNSPETRLHIFPWQLIPCLWISPVSLLVGGGDIFFWLEPVTHQWIRNQFDGKTPSSLKRAMCTQIMFELMVQNTAQWLANTNGRNQFYFVFGSICLCPKNSCLCPKNFA